MNPPEYVDVTCKNCGHAPEAHCAGHGQCYRCDAKLRCAAYVPKTEDAAMIQLRDHPKRR